MDDRDAAARADRRAVDVAHLRAGAADLVGDRGRAGVAIADREAADLARRAQVALHQRRRKRLHVGDVVEALADGVGRQERGDVDVDAEQVAHRVLVLRTVQALERTPAGIRDSARRRRRSRVSSESHERRDRGRVRAPRVGRRHHAGAQLADHLLRDVGMLSDGRGVEAGEHQLAGLDASRCGSRRSTARPACSGRRAAAPTRPAPKVCEPPRAWRPRSAP